MSGGIRVLHRWDEWLQACGVETAATHSRSKEIISRSTQNTDKVLSTE